MNGDGQEEGQLGAVAFEGRYGRGQYCLCDNRPRKRLGGPRTTEATAGVTAMIWKPLWEPEVSSWHGQQSETWGCEHCSAVSVFVLLPRPTDRPANLPDVLDMRNDIVTGEERHEQV